ncbi:tail protein X [Ureibacillus thermosphaericus]|uniref:tail protein X n=1 Tax=Ureibacillus thermosphaericus TaxID=51173 RepID=UPI00288AC725|nr:phage tail protein [Ureibacillus thermosphaericus]
MQGDTWDLISYKLWGSEYLFPLLIEANPKHNGTVIFSGGVLLNVPEIDEMTTSTTSRPPWLGEEDEL